MNTKTIYLLVLAAALFFTKTSAQQTAKLTSTGIGYLEYLPQAYKSNNNDYPLVISLHGIGEKGNSLSDAARVANVGLPRYVKSGQQYPFILISPQLKTSMSRWTGDYVMQVLNHVKKTLRIDESRIYLTGLSLGGGGVWSVVSANPTTFAAIVPVCSGYNTVSAAATIAGEDIPVWAFHGDRDGTVSYTVTQKMISALNGCSPRPSPLAKFTIFPGMGHSIWDKVYKQTNALDWMLGYRKGSSSPSPAPGTNKLPVVNAGTDKTTTNKGLTIVGRASDADGHITSYRWTKISGPNIAMGNTSTSKLWVSKLIKGTYYFRLTATDNKGATVHDDMKLVVPSS